MSSGKDLGNSVVSSVHCVPSVPEPHRPIYQLCPELGPMNPSCIDTTWMTEL